MNGGPFSILLVEDDDAHAEIILRNLAKQPLPPIFTRAKDGQEALDLLYRRCRQESSPTEPMPGLVLLDLRLPRVDGIEVLTSIKSDPDLQHLPVVVLTTSTAKRDISAAYRAKANSYLVKPTDAGAFSHLLESLCTYWLTTNEQPQSHL